MKAVIWVLASTPVRCEDGRGRRSRTVRAWLIHSASNSRQVKCLICSINHGIKNISRVSSRHRSHWKRDGARCVAARIRRRQRDNGRERVSIHKTLVQDSLSTKLSTNLSSNIFNFMCPLIEMSLPTVKYLITVASVFRSVFFWYQKL